MPEKFYNQDYSHQKHSTEDIAGGSVPWNNKQALSKILLHPGYCGKNHLDSRGHSSWNRKGKW